MDLDTGEEEEEDSATAASSDDKKQQHLLQTQDSKVEAWTEGVSQLPPEPEGICNPSLQKYITELWTRQQETAYDMNAVIQSKKGFRNPSIYDKLIQHCGIDEHGTNFPKELYDGHLFGEESYYDVLAKAQNEMEKKAEARKKEASLRAQPEPKRKSRFDQGQLASSSSSLPSANVAAAQAQAASVAANLPASDRQLPNQQPPKRFLRSACSRNSDNKTVVVAIKTLGEGCQKETIPKTGKRCCE